MVGASGADPYVEYWQVDLGPDDDKKARYIPMDTRICAFYYSANAYPTLLPKPEQLEQLFSTNDMGVSIWQWDVSASSGIGENSPSTDKVIEYTNNMIKGAKRNPPHPAKMPKCVSYPPKT